MAKAPLYRATSSGTAVQEVENNPGSIGYAPLYLANQAHDVTLLSIDGQNPTNASLIQQNTYKFWNIEHMYTRGPGSLLAQSFLAYISSGVVNTLIAHFNLLQVNTVPQNVRNQHILESQ